MKVKFINGREISYDVKGEGVQYDEILEKYCDCYEISYLGWVSKDVLAKVEETEGLIDSNDLYLELLKNGKIFNN